MKLFYSQTSPYSRKVRVLLRELNLDVEEVAVNTADNDPEFLAANPLGKVPALMVDAATPLFDSQLICSYLDEKYNRGAFHPKTWDHKLFVTACHGLTDEAVTMIIEKRRPEDKIFDYWLKRYAVAIPRTLTWLWQNHRPYISEKLDLGTITLVSCLEYVEFRHPEVAWQKPLPDLEAWYRQALLRPSFQETRPK